MQVVAAIDNAMCGMSVMTCSVALSMLKGMASAKAFWSSQNKALQPGSPAATKQLKDIMAKASYCNVRYVST